MKLADYAHKRRNLPPLLLDTYTARAAWSLRKLSNAYKGPCLRVRRSSDNAEADIYFNAGWVNFSAMMAWAGSDTVYVPIYYDQSGNGLNLIQPTASVQPIIAEAGVIVVGEAEGSSRPGVRMFYPNTGFYTADSTLWNGQSYLGACAVARRYTGANNNENLVAIVTATNASRLNINRPATGLLRSGMRRLSTDTVVYATSTGDAWPDFTSKQVTALINYTNGAGRLRVGGSELAQATTSTGTSAVSNGPVFVGYFRNDANGGSRWIGDITEIILINDTNKRAAIESDQKAFYGL